MMCDDDEAVWIHPTTAVSWHSSALSQCFWYVGTMLQVLGAGYRFSTNPRTGDVDYIEVDSGYMMSAEAYSSLGIRKSPSNESVQGVPAALPDAGALWPCWTAAQQGAQAALPAEGRPGRRC